MQELHQTLTSLQLLPQLLLQELLLLLLELLHLLQTLPLEPLLLLKAPILLSFLLLQLGLILFHLPFLFIPPNFFYFIYAAFSSAIAFSTIARLLIVP